MAMVAQILLNGISLAMMYGLMAIGLTLVFGVMRIVQYAHGEFYMLGAYLLYFLFVELHVPYWLSFVLSLVGIFAGAYLAQLSLFRPLIGKDMLYSLALSMGLIFILSNGGLILFGTVARGIPSVIHAQLSIFGAVLTWERLAICLISGFMLLLLYLFLKKTRLGMAMRAVSENSEVSALQGIDPKRIHAVAFGIAGALAAVAGCLMGTLISISPTMGFGATLKSFIIVILGGLGSIPGALVGAAIIGSIDSVGTTLLGADIAYVASFLFVFIFLVFKPSGIFGIAERS